MRRSVCLLFFLLLIACHLYGQFEPELTVHRTHAPLTNKDILEMVRAKFSDATITQTIKANETQFDVSVPALVNLKRAGVNEPVIQAMIAAGQGTKPTNPAGKNTAAEDGVTVNKGERSDSTPIDVG